MAWLKLAIGLVIVFIFSIALAKLCVHLEKDQDIFDWEDLDDRDLLQKGKHMKIFENHEEIIATVENSSCIKEFAYNKENGILTVTFTHGGKYDYPGVPEKVVRDWMGAESAGKFFNKEIRYGYSYNA